MRRLALVLLLTVATVTWAQEQAELNSYYYYPVSAGFGYRQITPFADFASSFSVHELTATARVPFPAAPLWTGLLKGGLIQFDSQDQASPERWDHQHLFLAPGVGATLRLSKEFEAGAELMAGLTQSIFPNVIEEPIGSLNLVAGVEAKLTLNPSFNVSIDITPGVRYLRSLSPFNEYDGLFFGLGIGAHYRFGRDPDSADTLIRAIRFGEIDLPDVFAAMQSYYVSNPVGTVTITNTERYAITDVQLSFFQNGYMDSPTPSARIDRLEPGESVEVSLLASFNNEVFLREGVTPLTGEVIATYSARGRPADQRQPVTYDLHDKTALTWDDDRKVGAFITPADSALRNYASYIRRATQDERVAGLSRELQSAMQIYHGIAELDIIYQEDPTSPFTRVQEDAFLVDSISLPRDTLTRATGDCDDLTVLYVSLLESLGVETGFMTVPGHIYAAINTGMGTRELSSLFPDRGMVIDVDGTAWVPVEITLIGRQGFMDAWRTGSRLWEAAADEPETRGFYLTSDAQSRYRPVGLSERDLGLQYPEEAALRRGFATDRDRLVTTILDPLRRNAVETGEPRAWNAYGIKAAELGRYADAATAFREASRLNRTWLSPQINLGAVSFLDGDFRGALSAFQQAERLLLGRGRDGRSRALATVLVNIARTHYEMDNFSLAQNYYDRAAEEEPEVVQEFTYLANVADERAGARASSIDDGPRILFSDEEE